MQEEAEEVEGLKLLGGRQWLRQKGCSAEQWCMNGEWLQYKKMFFQAKS